MKQSPLSKSNIASFSFGFVCCAVLVQILGLGRSSSLIIAEILTFGGDAPFQECEDEAKRNKRASILVTVNDNNATTSSSVKKVANVETVNPKQKGWEPMVQQDIIPESLRGIYEPEQLQFNVTRSMLRRSRPVVGNVQRLHKYLQKLQQGLCTNILIFGGSVTLGHNAGGPDIAYPRHFIDWLNARYPCVDERGEDGLHQYFSAGVASSQQAFSWREKAMGNIDLVIIEYNVNDDFISSVSHALEDKGQLGSDKIYSACWYNEVLIRKLLLFRAPDPVALVVFNADYVGRVWATPPYQDPYEARRTLFHRNGEPVKFWLSSIYELPMISANSWMLPMAQKLGVDMQFNYSYPFNTAGWHADACCHPRKQGHRLLSLVLAYSFEEEMNIMNQGERPSYWEHDFTTDSPPVLPTPMYLSREEDQLWVQNPIANSNASLIDFHDPASSKWEDFVVENTGWDWFADNREKDKFGLIANSTVEQDWDPHLALNVTGQKHGYVEAGYIASYENFGTSLVWIDEDISPPVNCTVGSLKARGVGENQIKKLESRWVLRASVPKYSLLTGLIKSGQRRVLHICLMKPGDVQLKNNEGNKFKLLVIRSI